MKHGQWQVTYTVSLPTLPSICCGHHYIVVREHDFFICMSCASSYATYMVPRKQSHESIAGEIVVLLE